MAEIEVSAIREETQRIVQQIVRRFHPLKVILFGSYAYGQPHEGSDLDLLVIVQNPLPRKESWKVSSDLTQRSSLPLQIIFVSPEEFEETKDVVGSVVYPAHHWGKILYEANA